MASSGTSGMGGGPGRSGRQDTAGGPGRGGRQDTVGPDDREADNLPISLVGALFRLAPRLVELIDLGERDYGLGFARGRVLWSLRESGPVVMRALSQALGVSPRTVTGLVDSLEADGWVTRSPHPNDRR